MTDEKQGIFGRARSAAANKMTQSQQRKAESRQRSEQAALEWYERLSLGTVMKGLTASGDALVISTAAVSNENTQGIVNAQTAHLQATLLVLKRLDRIVELLEADAATHPSQRA